MIQLLENKNPSAHLPVTIARGHEIGRMPSSPAGHAPLRTNNRLKLASVFARLVP